MLLAADHFFTKVNAKKNENENTSWEDPSVASLSSDEGPRLISVKQVLHIAEPFELEGGESLPELDVIYETFGTLNDKKDNAILVIHALTGDSHCCGYYTYYPKEKAGWWSSLIGPGKAIDTNKYFVICTNNLGGCSNDVYPPVEGAPAHTTNPASIDPRTGKRYNMTFPEYTFGDAVNVQKLVVDHFGIKRLLAVVGGSMGGMMTLEWARRYPDNLSCIIAVATNAHLSPQGIAFSEVERQSIRLDPKWKGGDSGETKWADKTFHEIIADLMTAVGTVQKQLKANFIPATSKFKIVIPVGCDQYLGKVPECGGKTVREWIKDQWKKCEIHVDPAFDEVLGGENVFYVIVDEIGSSPVVDQHVPASLFMVGSMQREAGRSELWSFATAGAFVKQPLGVGRFFGI